MKFKVRKGFVVHYSKVVEIPSDFGDDPRRETQTQTFWEGQQLNLTAPEADEHLHKLEAVDKEASAYLDSRAVPTPPPAQDLNQAALAAAVAEAVTKALAARPPA